jgi:glyoxylase-like metal-dependent hydrolase (beta-lactamase superfamily II)
MSHRIALLCLCISLVCPGLGFGQDQPAAEITVVRGDLYQVKSGDQAALFLVTSDGILLADPLNPTLGRWLKSELETRFPGRPVRYVVYTGHDYDRAGGAWVFNETAEIVGSDGFQSARGQAAQSLPRSWVSFDRNQNAVLERSEAVALGPEALTRDRNTDGIVTAGEAWGDVSSPETSYRGRREIQLGGQRVELIHPGDGLGGSSTVVLFPTQRVLFAPGISIHEAPETFQAATASEFIESLQQVERLAFDTLITGRGEVSSLADLALLREYVEEMVKGVKAGVRAGDSVEQLQTTLALERFNTLRDFNTRRARNISETYAGIRLFTIGASGAAQYALVQRGVPDCQLNGIPTIQVACEGVGGSTFAGSFGGSVMVGRVGGAVEISRTGTLTGLDQRFGAQVVSYSHYETTMAFLFRYEPAPRGSLGLAVTGGLARIAARARADGQLAFYLPANYVAEASAMAPMFGADLVFGNKVKLTVPVRIMREPEDLFTQVGSNTPKWNLRVGVGITIPVARVVW